MGIVELLSLSVSVIGAIVSICAWRKAVGARKAVENTIKRRNQDEDLQRLRDLISTLKKTKDAVKPWVSGIGTVRQKGRRQDKDVTTLMDAIDILKTKAPLSLDDEQTARIKETTKVLDKHVAEIKNPTNSDDNWQKAFIEIQTIIPLLDGWERELRDKNVSM